MNKDRKTDSMEVQRQISKIRNLYESIGEPIDFDTAVELSLHLGKVLDMAKEVAPIRKEKRNIM